MAGKKIKLYLVSILLLLSIFIYGCYIIRDQSTTKLPDTFAINFYGTGHSSGASRFYDASLVFKDNKIISGKQHYRSLAPNREDLTFETIERNVYCNLDINTLQWLNQENKQCTSDMLQLPLTIEALQQKIDSGEFLRLVPVKERSNFKIYYEIVK